MWIRSSPIVLISLLAVQQATAQQPQPSVQIMAQAYDRCMATYAVRLTHTAAPDADIFMQASEACLPLKEQLRAAIQTQLPPPQATQILQSIDAQAEPNFMTMLTRIRSDRAQRAGQ